MRFKLLPDETFATHVRSLDSRILDAGDLVNAETFPDFADKAAIAVLERFFERREQTRAPSGWRIAQGRFLFRYSIPVLRQKKYSSGANRWIGELSGWYFQSNKRSAKTKFREIRLKTGRLGGL